VDALIVLLATVLGVAWLLWYQARRDREWEAMRAFDEWREALR
jgi:hypothetical protein